MGRLRAESGFSLIEVALSIVLLLSMTIAASNMLKGAFDAKIGLSQRAKVTHRLQSAMDRVARDLEHAFIVSSTDTQRNGIDRRQKSIFRIDEGGDSDKLAFTTNSHRPYLAGAKESGAVYVVYEVRESREIPGRKHLYRGLATVIPEDFREDPPMRLLAKHVKSFKIEAWNGDGWVKDRWDSTRSEWRNKLPRIVKVTIEVNAVDVEADDEDRDSRQDEASESVTSVIYLPMAQGIPEVKESTASVKWDRF